MSREIRKQRDGDGRLYIKRRLKSQVPVPRTVQQTFVQSLENIRGRLMTDDQGVMSGSEVIFKTRGFETPIILMVFPNGSQLHSLDFKPSSLCSRWLYFL